MLTALVVAVHLAATFAMIFFILLHSGKGGGLGDMLGGVGSSAAGSAVVERNLDRMTVVSALVFAFTTVILAIRLQ